MTSSALYRDRVTDVEERSATPVADPVRLLYVRDTLTICGPGKTILNTWRTIDRSRYHVTIVATEPNAGGRNLLLDTARRLGARAIDLSIGRGVDLVAAWKLIRLIKEHRIDILQTHDAQTRRIGVIAAALTGVHHITSVHGWIFNDRKEQVAKWLDARLIGHADAVIAVSDKLQQELVAAGVPAEKITVLHNAIVVSDYAPAAGAASMREELGILNDQPVISIVGRLSLEKGHHIFLQAARLVVNEVPDARFLIVGDGPLEAPLRESVERLGLGRNVIFTGHRSNLAGIYGITDVLVISSFTEGVPNVLLEAFAYGKPAVATAVGGVPEVMRNGVDGWIVESGDHAAIAARTLMLLENPALRRQMGAAGRAAIEDKFNFAHRTRALEQLYARAAANLSERHAR
jgi:glycosyltransferase involved in cell wall biosynthesis